MAEYMALGGFTPPRKVLKFHKSPPVKRFDSLNKLPHIVETDKALTPLVPVSSKVPRNNNAAMSQAMDYVAAYNRLKAQFRQESSEVDGLPYIFEK